MIYINALWTFHPVDLQGGRLFYLIILKEFFYFQKACIQLCSCYALVSELTKRTDCYNLWKIHCGNVKKECIQLRYCYALLSKHNLELRKESTVTIYGKYSMQVIWTLQKPPKLAFASLFCYHSSQQGHFPLYIFFCSTWPKNQF